MADSLMDRLRQDYESAPSPAERDLRGVRYGIALAQAGAVQEARGLASLLRETGYRQRSDSSSIYLLLLDGVLLYYAERSEGCLDKARRAQLLAAAVKNYALEAEASVWSALFAFNFDKYSTLEDSLSIALANFSCLSLSLRSRLTGTVADILQVSGRMVEMGEWYRVARELSRAASDHVLLAALEFNRLASGLTRHRFQELFGEESGLLSGRRWAIEYESVRALQVGFGNDALADLLIVCDARYKHACGENLRAYQLLSGLRDQGRASAAGSSQVALDAEVAWYAALAGVSDEAFASRIRVRSNELLEEHADEVDFLFYLSELSKRTDIFVDPVRLENLLQSGRLKLKTHLTALEHVADVVFAHCSTPSVLLKS